jgi:hypothetical protein
MKHDWEYNASERFLHDSPFILKLYDWECKLCGCHITTTSRDKRTIDLLEKQSCPYHDVREIMES